MLKEVVLDAPGEKVFLLGNEAIARGAIEAGIDIYSAYPGTPSSEIVDTLSQACRLLKGKMDFYLEYSVNEKVAFEVAVGASLAGKRGMCGMKHVGVNVAADALFSFAYMGARGGFVCISADDPSMHSSQNEQDNRWYGIAAKIPVVEPTSPQEAKDYVGKAFEISEKFGVPVIFRTVTRLNHGSGVVELGKIPEKKLEKAEWKRNPPTDVLVPGNARRQKLVLLEKIEKVREYFEKSELNWIEGGDSDKGVIASGIAYRYTKEALNRLEKDLPLLKLSTTNPLPEKLVEDFISNLDGVAIVEELDPFVEMQVRAIAGEYGVEIYGKKNGHFPMHYEYTVHTVEKGIAMMLDESASVCYDEVIEKAKSANQMAPLRPPVFCPGCPHAASYYAIKEVAGEEALPSDIGCYTLGVNRPFEAVDITLCMGGGFGISNGLSRVVKNKVIATAGDSTFFHASLPALVNAVYNRANVVFVVLDNSTTAMTGHQPHPGMDVRGCGEEGHRVRIEDVARAVGVEFVEVVNPYNIRKMENAIKSAMEHDGVAVVVARQLCAILWNRERKRKGVRIRPFEVTEDCVKCLKCVSQFACPAIVYDGENVWIDETLCAGCGVCTQICPERAIKPAR
ncbi:indolepyruvate ferredoxin oxidoreductase subunit alpha [Geoglobus acetivorans]|uniref:Indolepyruvate oxidoreductase subunit IorA n=1 Tax=Geoglobus acetivorans TaxID=565033 RepID=A0ABZ3H5C9_GEOAI|nr:indolepyruvate ferredoxin oxidoreductase subunit alpha [Geoglobus acetivorans]